MSLDNKKKGLLNPLALKLVAADRGRRSAEASLRSTEAQANEQRQKLHYTEIELVMAKQQKFYNLGVQETKARLTDQLAKVCRDYYLEAPEATLGLGTDTAPASLTPKQLPIAQASLPPPEASKGLGKANDPGHGVEVAKGKEAGQGRAWPHNKGKGKEAKTLPETQGPEVAPKAKDATSKAKETTPRAADPPVSQPTSKDDPPHNQGLV
nr:hypothetical protein CFP56_59908 [Quercus suber]